MWIIRVGVKRQSAASARAEGSSQKDARHFHLMAMPSRLRAFIQVWTLRPIFRGVLMAPAAGKTRAFQRRLNAVPRWPLYVLGAVPGVWVFWLALNDNLGADPIKALEHTLGLWALRF